LFDGVLIVVAVMVYLIYDFIHKTRILFSHTILTSVAKLQAVFTLSVSGVILSSTVTLSVIVNGEVFVSFAFGHSCTLVQYLIQSHRDPLDAAEVGELVRHCAIILGVHKTPLWFKLGQSFCRM